MSEGLRTGGPGRVQGCKSIVMFRLASYKGVRFRNWVRFVICSVAEEVVP
jgi:hypothetical protein